MHKDLIKYIEGQVAVQMAKYKLIGLKGIADKVPVPERLRPATEADIKIGEVIWYPPVKVALEEAGEETIGPHWEIIEEVLRSKDLYKAYVAESGCRYGLDGAFVEIEE